MAARAAEGEGNSGRHGKGIATLSGGTPEIMRTGYYDPRKKRGHFPFDDRLGLVGRYTPAVAREAAGYAVGHPCRGAAAEFAGKIIRGRGKGAGRASRSGRAASGA